MLPPVRHTVVVVAIAKRPGLEGVWSPHVECYCSVSAHIENISAPQLVNHGNASSNHDYGAWSGSQGEDHGVPEQRPARR
eukprot:2991523-Rhodomonas_salina.3